jgi:HlyD family secretion protein
VIGIVASYISGIEKKPQPPAFQPASNPYAKGIYANGIVESYQSNGANINIYPEVAGTIKKILVSEGEIIKKGAPLILIDDAVQMATAEQQKAQIELAGASLKSVQDQLDKLRESRALEPRSVSKNDLDNAENAVNVAKANLEVARKQYELAQTLLSKYFIKAPMDGAVLSVNAAVGSYVSAQGSYDTYTQGFTPILVMGSSQAYIGVRCYIDEVLISRLPPASQMHAQMLIRGTNISIPLEFVRVQPYVSPKIALSNQRTERVDVRVLPVIFRFERPKNIDVYPGQLVDVYIGDKETETKNTGTHQ